MIQERKRIVGPSQEPTAEKELLKWCTKKHSYPKGDWEEWMVGFFKRSKMQFEKSTGYKGEPEEIQVTIKTKDIFGHKGDPANMIQAKFLYAD